MKFAAGEVCAAAMGVWWAAAVAELGGGPERQCGEMRLRRGEEARPAVVSAETARDMCVV